MEKAKPLRKLWVRILLAVGICAADLLLGAGYLYWRKEQGILYSVRNASSCFPGILWQSVFCSLFPFALLLIAAFRLKKALPARMYFTLKGTWQRMTALLLCIAILGITVYCLAAKGDPGTILFNLLYYLLFISFTEEFVVRSVCADLLHTASWPIRYLVPNASFALMHVFSYAQFGTITGSYLVRFLTSDFLGLVFGGCMFQLLKEKSGTIWIPILLHGLMDYTDVLSY